jgi:hypothetical protein
MILGLTKHSAWSKEEIKKLNSIYTSDKTFDEILIEFPDRTSNAIRLKASRLGLRRPTISTSMIQSDNILKCNVKEDSYGILLKCHECGSWIQIIDIQDDTANTVSCQECNSFFQILYT